MSDCISYPDLSNTAVLAFDMVLSNHIPVRAVLCTMFSAGNGKERQEKQNVM